MMARAQASQRFDAGRLRVLPSAGESRCEVSNTGSTSGAVGRGAAGDLFGNGDPPSLMLWGTEEEKAPGPKGRFGAAG